MDVMSYMFGSTLAITDNDAKISIILSIAVLIVFILFYNKLFAVTLMRISLKLLVQMQKLLI